MRLEGGWVGEPRSEGAARGTSDILQSAGDRGPPTLPQQ